MAESLIQTIVPVVCVRYYASGSQAFGRMNFDTLSYDTWGGTVTVGANWVFTAPLPGIYNINASAAYSYPGNTPQYTLQIYQNGNPGKINYAGAYGWQPTCIVEDDVEMALHDTIYIFSAANVGGDIIAASATNVITIKKVG